MVGQASLTVEQYPHYPRVGTGESEVRYRVVQAINTTTPKIDDRLTEAQVKELIDVIGFKVTIKAAS